MALRRELLTAWSSWAGKLAAGRPDDEDGLQSIIEDLEELERLMEKRTWEIWAPNLWDTLWSGLAAIVRDCQRLLELAQQGSTTLQRAATGSVNALAHPLSFLQKCPLDVVQHAVNSQQHVAVTHFFMEAAPQLLLDASAAVQGGRDEAGNDFFEDLARSLLLGAQVLLMSPLLEVLHVSVVEQGVERWLDAMVLLAKDPHIEIWVPGTLFNVLLMSCISDEAVLQQERMLELVAATPDRAALAFRSCASKLSNLASLLEASDSEPVDEGDEENLPTHMYYLACISSLDQRFEDAKLFCAAARSFPNMIDEICSALSMLSGPIESAIRRYVPDMLEEQRGALILGWANGWSRCIEAIYEVLPASLPHAEQVLAAAVSALHIAAAAEGWFEDRRCQGSCKKTLKWLPIHISGLYNLALRMVEQAADLIRAALDNPTLSRKEHAAKALSALQHIAAAQSEALAAWQRWQRGSIKAALEGHRDIDAWLLALVGEAGEADANLLLHCSKPQLLEPLCRNLCSSLEAALCQTVQVQVKLAHALSSIEGGPTPRLVSELAVGLSLALNLSSSVTCHDPTVTNASEAGGIEGPLPAVPYLLAIPATRTLLHMARGLPVDSSLDRSVALLQLAQGFHWQLKWQHGRALRGGAAELMAASCRELPPHQRWILATGLLNSMHDWETDATALGCIPLLRLVAEGLARRLVQQSEGPPDPQAERLLSMAATRVLKRCCTLVDAAAGTSFGAQDAGLEAAGAARLRQLLSTGQPNAADAVRVHVWGQRAETLLPHLQQVVRRAVQVVVCAPKFPSGRTGPGIAVLPATDSRQPNGSWVPLCPLAALESEVDRVPADGSCHSPACCIALVAEGSKLVVCRGCGLARYCSASCAQADWRRHGPVCKTLLQLRGQYHHKYALVSS